MIEFSAALNIAGLLLDIVGVVLIFRFGLPSKIDPEGHIFVVAHEKDETEIKLASTYLRWGRTGLCLLISGFLLQAAGSAVVLVYAFSASD